MPARGRFLRNFYHFLKFSFRVQFQGLSLAVFLIWCRFAQGVQELQAFIQGYGYVFQFWTPLAAKLHVGSEKKVLEVQERYMAIPPVLSACRTWTCTCIAHSLTLQRILTLVKLKPTPTLTSSRGSSRGCRCRCPCLRRGMSALATPAAADAWVGWSVASVNVCLCVGALKGKRLELSAPNLLLYSNLATGSNE